MGRVTERLGRSGEYFVASILCEVSDTVVVVPHGSEADIIFDYEDVLYKCQVKTKSKREKKHPNWRFDCRRGSHTKNRNFQPGQVDLYAFFSKEYQNVVFMPFDDNKTQMIIDDDIMKKADPLASFYQCIKDLN
ncbi:MAG: hypothetical protein CMQ88_00355 [Gammaproteobacteria bacterium]|jgi:hypothetical protein|nr:hypothetical protein [Gammaproteobacteria bacterium]|tara:strand:+ start:1028 stop:1429 length:402 start_codon:yes stop_codon:yes gene_type:complete